MFWIVDWGLIPKTKWIRRRNINSKRAAERIWPITFGERGTNDGLARSNFQSREPMPWT